MVKKIKTVNWNVEKVEDLRVVITDKNGYKTSILLSHSCITEMINVFYFSDNSEVKDCLHKVESKEVE